MSCLEIERNCLNERIISDYVYIFTGLTASCENQKILLPSNTNYRLRFYNISVNFAEKFYLLSQRYWCLWINRSIICLFDKHNKHNKKAFNNNVKKTVNDLSKIFICCVSI